jgi:cation diffusion facilitator family transporter
LQLESNGSPAPSLARRAGIDQSWGSFETELRTDTSAQEVYRSASQAAAIGVAANLVLGTIKLVGGWIGDSFALLSDAVNSFGDVVTSLVLLLAIRVAQKPADEEHPFGHSQAESIAASNVALLVLVSAMGIGWRALRRWNMPHPLPPNWTLGIAGANARIKEGLYWYKTSVARRTGSKALLAHAWDHRSDAFCSLAVLVGLAVVRWGGPAWIAADEVAALVVVRAILWSATKLFRQSVSELMDMQADAETVDSIRKLALCQSGVKGIEKLWVRKSELELFVDIHVEVDAGIPVGEGHAIGHQVKDALKHRFPILREVLVHLEPWEGAGDNPAGYNPAGCNHDQGIPKGL